MLPAVLWALHRIIYYWKCSYQKHFALANTMICIPAFFLHNAIALPCHAIPAQRKERNMYLICKLGSPSWRVSIFCSSSSCSMLLLLLVGCLQLHCTVEGAPKGRKATSRRFWKGFNKISQKLSVKGQIMLEMHTRKLIKLHAQWTGGKEQRNPVVHPAPWAKCFRINSMWCHFGWLDSGKATAAQEATSAGKIAA